ncbi:MAG: hypothetical protein GY924_00930, partial [Planctomycetaceae bacterium]|nr:hypothetical protein [Planctomycetaceae bacterium]
MGCKRAFAAASITLLLVIRSPLFAFETDQNDESVDAKWNNQFAANELLPPAFRQFTTRRKDDSKLTVFLGNFDNS